MPDNTLNVIINMLKKGTGDKEAASGLQKLKTGFKDLTGTSLGTATALGAVGLALRGVVKFTKEAVNETVSYNKSIREMAQVTGLGSEEISRIVQVGDDWGISIEALRTSLGYMNKMGITPSIDNLAKLADEYVNSTNKAEFAEKAAKLLGRGYQTLIPILAKGGDALRVQTDAIEDNLIATQDEINASREYEVAVDNLTDAWTGFKQEVGNAVIPVLTDLLESMNEHRTVQQKLKDALDEGKISQERYNVAIAETIIYGKGYSRVLDELASQEGVEIGLTGQWVGWLKKQTTETDSATVSIENLSYATGDLNLALQGAHSDSQKAMTAMQDLRLKGIDLLKDATLDLVNDAIGKYTDSLTETMILQAAFKLSLNEITQAEYDQTVAIAEGLKPLESMAQLVKDGTIDITYLKQAMADGTVTAAELTAAYIATGLSAEEARLKVLGLTDAINAMPTHQLINIDIVYNPGQMPPPPGGAPIMNAEGGDYMVNRPTLFMAGEAGPERAVFIPQTTNNFNLSLTGTGNAGRDVLSTVRLLEMMYGQR